MHRTRLGGDAGVTAVLGSVLMLALMMTLIPGALLLKAAVSEEMAAQREAAEHAAWCARRPEIGPPDCPDRGPMPGYLCTEVELEVWVCGRDANRTAVTPRLPTPTPASTPIAPTLAVGV